MKTLNNIIKVIISNIIFIIAGIFVGFLLPRIISKSDFGLYKIYTLYFNYLGILSLGIIDGIVLRYGGNDYENLDRSYFRGYFSCYFIVNILFAVITLIVSFFIKNLDYKFIILMLGIAILPCNIVSYLQQISKITQRFKEYSICRIIQSVANIILILSMFLLYKYDYKISYKFYLVGFSLINILFALWYIFTYRDITIGRQVDLTISIKETFSLAKLGLPLLLANLCSTLLLSLDRQFVSVLYTTEEYATYAFAYSMLSIVTVATSAISTVIYPVFKRTEVHKLEANYSIVCFTVLAFVFLALIVYYPLYYFILWFLPQYAESIMFFKIILPGLAISSSITIVMHNYYKVLDKNEAFFIKSIIVLIISFSFNLMAYFVFRTREAITTFSVLSLLIWYFMVEMPLRKTCAVNIKHSAYMLLMVALFYLCTFIPTCWLGGIVYLISALSVTAVFGIKDFVNIKKMLLK